MIIILPADIATIKLLLRRSFMRLLHHSAITSKLTLSERMIAFADAYDRHLDLYRQNLYSSNSIWQFQKKYSSNKAIIHYSLSLFTV